MKNFKMLLILLLLCFILTACNNKGRGGSEPEPVTTVPASTVPQKSSAVNDCVAAAREETFTCTDKNKNTVETTYRIPALKFDTPDALEINGDIQKRYSDAFSEAKEAESNNKTPAYDSIDYEAYVNDDIVSIKITADNSPVFCKITFKCSFSVDLGLSKYLGRGGHTAQNLCHLWPYICPFFARQGIRTYFPSISGFLQVYAFLTPFFPR